MQKIIKMLKMIYTNFCKFFIYPQDEQEPQWHFRKTGFQQKAQESFRFHA